MPQLAGGGSTSRPPKPKPNPAPTKPPPPKPTPTYTSEAGITGSAQQQKAGNNKVADKVQARSYSKKNPFDVTAVHGNIQTGTNELVKGRNLSKNNTPIENAGGTGKEYGSGAPASQGNLKSGNHGGGHSAGGSTFGTPRPTSGGATSGGFHSTVGSRTIGGMPNTAGIDRGGPGRDTSGGRDGGGTQADQPPITRTQPIEGRVGGGFPEFGSGYRPPPAYFDSEGGGVSGGGQTGGATNPLASSVSSTFSQSSMEEVLHGNKKKGRAKRTRRTE